MDPYKEFADLLEKMTIAVVGREMAKHGVISKYPESFDQEVKKAKKEVCDFFTRLQAQDK